MNCQNDKLTIYRAGSVHELWTLSWPMILASASNCALLLVDRIVLSYHSQDAFNISVECMPWFLGFWFTFFSLIGITEVFVGQNNGAHKFKLIGPIVWQMVWVSLATYIIFIPICTHGARYMLSNHSEEALTYLRIILLYSPICYATFGALGSFFIGRGKTKFITILAITESILNAILDVLLVFGYLGFPKLGTAGAAYATLISQIVVFTIAFIVFVSKNNSLKYCTRDYKFKFSILKTCLLIGIPFSISSSINCFTFAFIVRILANYASVNEFTTFGITHSFYGALTFFMDGISKGVSTLCSNYIGSKQIYYIKYILLSALKLEFMFMLILFIVMIIFATSTIRILFPLTGSIAQNAAINLMPIVWVCLFLDGIVLYLQALLISTGDTKFIMNVNLCVFLSTVVIPGYIGITHFHFFSNFLWWLFSIDSMQRILAFYIRYRSERWKQIKILKKT